MQSPTVFIYLLFLLLILSAVESSTSWETVAQVRIECAESDSDAYISETYSGDFADYSRSNNVAGDLRLIEDPSFGCNGTTSLDARGEVVILEFTGVCSDYLQALAAEDSGAVGVVFYSPADRSLSSKPRYAPVITATVAMIRTSDDIVGMFGNKSPTPRVTITKDYHQVHEASHTFYFVVFAFCILMGLSCVWFVLSYVRRCCHSARNRQRRVQSENATQQVINKLPVKTYKSQKDLPDSEQPVCAVCLEVFIQNDTIRILTCKHEFHKKCVDPWLKIKRTCPICKQSISADSGRAHREKRDRDRQRQQGEEDVETGTVVADTTGMAVEEVEEGQEMREVRVTMEEAPSDNESLMEDAVTIRPEGDDSSLSVSSTMAFI